jgi:hypothetical protein
VRRSGLTSKSLQLQDEETLLRQAGLNGSLALSDG